MTNNLDDKKLLIIFLSPLMALMAPFLVFPIEYFLPFPYIIEEAAKAIIATQIVKLDDNRLRYRIAVVCGIGFTITESVLYSYNFFMMNSPLPVIERVLLTGVMHTATFLIILYPLTKNKKWLPAGYITAVIIHFLYNKYI